MVNSVLGRFTGEEIDSRCGGSPLFLFFALYCFVVFNGFHVGEITQERSNRIDTLVLPSVLLLQRFGFLL